MYFNCTSFQLIIITPNCADSNTMLAIFSSTPAFYLSLCPFLCPSAFLIGIHSCWAHSVPLLPSSWSINLLTCSSFCVCVCVHPEHPQDINSLQLFLLSIHSRSLCLHKFAYVTVDGACMCISASVPACVGASVLIVPICFLWMSTVALCASCRTCDHTNIFLVSPVSKHLCYCV